MKMSDIFKLSLIGKKVEGKSSLNSLNGSNTSHKNKEAHKMSSFEAQVSITYDLRPKSVSFPCLDIINRPRYSKNENIGTYFLRYFSNFNINYSINYP